MESAFKLDWDCKSFKTSLWHLAAGAILVPDFKNNPDQDDFFATPWGKE